VTVTYVDDHRRDDLRAAALFVVDHERQRHGYDKRVRGSLGLPDVGRIFDEMLSVFPLESEVGDAIRSVDELPCWREVLERLEPLWTAFPRVADPGALTHTDEWAALREAVQRCVDTHGLWYEEIEYPVTVMVDGGPLRADTWSAIERLGSAGAAGPAVRDACGRQVELELTPTPRVKRVGLPPPSARA
jgi:hypothetical protein